MSVGKEQEGSQQGVRYQEKLWCGGTVHDLSGSGVLSLGAEEKEFAADGGFIFY
jgi:hypothetical protein